CPIGGPLRCTAPPGQPPAVAPPGIRQAAGETRARVPSSGTPACAARIGRAIDVRRAGSPAMAGGPRQVREAGPPVPAPASISRAASPGPSPAPTRRPPGPASCVSVPGAPDRRRGALVPARAGPHAHQRGIIPMPGLMDPHEREEATMGSGQHHETVGARDAPGPALGVAPGAPPPDVVFRVRGVSKVYRMGEVEVHALRSVDLDLYAGELMVLLGAS